MDGIVYAYRNKINGKHYVGQVVAHRELRRRQEHAVSNGSSPIFHNAVKKYGITGFEYSILADGIKTKEDLDACEEYFIWLFQSQKHGYNMTTGGAGLSPESSAMYARNRSPQWYANQAEGVRKRKLNPEYLERKKQAAERLRNDPIYIAKMRSIGKYMVSQPRWLERVAFWNIQRCKPVVCVETGIVYLSGAEVQKVLGIPKSDITAVCKGRQPRARKLHWRYATEEEEKKIKGERIEQI